MNHLECQSIPCLYLKTNRNQSSVGAKIIFSERNRAHHGWASDYGRRVGDRVKPPRGRRRLKKFIKYQRKSRFIIKTFRSG